MVQGLVVGLVETLLKLEAPSCVRNIASYRLAIQGDTTGIKLLVTCKRALPSRKVACTAKIIPVIFLLCQENHEAPSTVGAFLSGGLSEASLL